MATKKREYAVLNLNFAERSKKKRLKAKAIKFALEDNQKEALKLIAEINKTYGKSLDIDNLHLQIINEELTPVVSKVTPVKPSKTPVKPAPVVTHTKTYSVDKKTLKPIVKLTPVSKVTPAEAVSPELIIKRINEKNKEITLINKEIEIFKSIKKHSLKSQKDIDKLFIKKNTLISHITVLEKQLSESTASKTPIDREMLPTLEEERKYYLSEINKYKDTDPEKAKELRLDLDELERIGPKDYVWMFIKTPADVTQPTVTHPTEEIYLKQNYVNFLISIVNQLENKDVNFAGKQELIEKIDLFIEQIEDESNLEKVLEIFHETVKLITAATETPPEIHIINGKTCILDASVYPHEYIEIKVVQTPPK